MSYKLLATATLVIAPIMAMIASRATQNMVAGRPAATTAAPTPAPPPPMTASSAPLPMAARFAGANVEFGAPYPLAGKPTLETAPERLPTAAAVLPRSGTLSPHPGQRREGGGTVTLPDGRKIG